CARLRPCGVTEGDAPCMSAATDPPCSSATTPVGLGSGRDPAVCRFALNQPVPVDWEPEPPGFSRRIGLGKHQLFVMGQRIDVRDVECRFDGTGLSIAGVVLMLPPDGTPSEAHLLRMYRDVPSVRAAVDRGMPVRQACALFEAEQDALIQMAARAMQQEGIHTARRVLEQSPLVEGVTVAENGGYSIRYRGLAFGYMSMEGFGAGPLLRTPVRPTREGYRRPLEIEHSRRLDSARRYVDYFEELVAETRQVRLIVATPSAP
ncbi:MAG: hypothetical protein ACE5G2_05815, partial [Candidatus Krumholzibacteriia bacterium]